MKKHFVGQRLWFGVVVSLMAAAIAADAGACLYNKCLNAAYGAFLQDSITIPMEMHGYSFNAKNGDAILIRVSRADGTLDPMVTLISPLGNLVAWAGMPQTGYADLTARANSGDGNYVAVISDFMGNLRGGYYISFQCGNRPVNPRELTPDIVVQDSIVQRTEMIPYRFSALAGDVVTVRMNRISHNIEPRLQLFGPTGRSYGEAVGESSAELTDREVDDNGTYTVIVSDIAGDDTGEFSLILSQAPADCDDAADGRPGECSLFPNYPNPFNPKTTIAFNLPRYGFVSLAVFNILGEEVRTLVSDLLPPGRHAVTWDGTDAVGEAAASGIYFYRLAAGDFVETRKMLLLK